MSGAVRARHRERRPPSSPARRCVEWRSGSQEGEDRARTHPVSVELTGPVAGLFFKQHKTTKMEQNLKLFFKMTQSGCNRKWRKSKRNPGGIQTAGPALGPRSTRAQEQIPGNSKRSQTCRPASPGLFQGTRVPAARASHPGGGLAAPQALHGLEEVPF